MDVDQAAELIVGRSDRRLLLIADHASNQVPPHIDLGIPSELFHDHIAVDIGAGPLSHALAARLGCPAILARWSRLVVDLNREADEPGALPATSDGWTIPGNAALDEAGRAERIERYWRPYHALVEAELDTHRPKMLVSLHSFTPQLATRPAEKRPWQVGILYNRDDRAAALAIPLLREAGLVTGDNEPYSGRELNLTMNRHAEARGLPYLGIEVRQDLIGDAAGVEKWADLLAPVIERVAAELACAEPLHHGTSV